MRKTNIQMLACAAALAVNTTTMAQNPLELVLDGYAYQVFSDVIIDLPNKTFTVANSEASNCQQPSGAVPENSAGNFTLLTNNQSIGILRSRLVVASNLLYLSSETSNLLCDNGIFVDLIFDQDFEPISF